MTVRNSMPSVKMGEPNANRGVPYVASTPTVAMSRPKKRLMKAFVREPPPRETTLVSPKRTTAKYSGVEKVSANLATGSDRVTMTTADSNPPTRAAQMVQPNALAA